MMVTRETTMAGLGVTNVNSVFSVYTKVFCVLLHFTCLHVFARTVRIFRNILLSDKRST